MAAKKTSKKELAEAREALEAAEAHLRVAPFTPDVQNAHADALRRVEELEGGSK